MSLNSSTKKKKTWWLLIGLILIAIIFAILTTMIGAVLNFVNDKQYHFDVIAYWKTAINNKYPLLLSLLLSILIYFYFVFKLYHVKTGSPRFKTTRKKEYGQARWATNNELNKNYPLINSNQDYHQHGFVVNSNKKRDNVTFNIRTNTHSLVIGGTGSGKTQGLVLPTININSKSREQPSLVITDPKGELYQEQKILLETSGYQVLALNLREVNQSIAWNPLATIYQQFKAMLLSADEQEQLQLKVMIQSDIQDLTKTLFAANQEQDPFWTNSGALITEAIILAMLEDVVLAIKKSQVDSMITLEQILPLKKFNLASVTIIASMPKEMSNWLNNRDDTSLAKIIAAQVLQGASKTLTSILMTMSTKLSLFKNDFIRNLTCNNDLNFEDFITKPTALFIIVPDENHNYYVFIALLINQLYKFLVTKANNNNNKLARPVYFLCDEFGNVPAIANFDAIITVARSRNIFFQLILQDLKQLTSKYGKEKANIIFTNCNLHIFLQTIDLETAERYSKMIGDTTVVKITTNNKGKTKSESETLTGHRLILASDLMKLPPKQAIVFYARENPVKTKLLPWYKIKPTVPNDKTITNKLTLINFNKEYYYDLKTKLPTNDSNLTKKINRSKTKADKTINLASKSSLKKEIWKLEIKLTEYQDDGSDLYQELITKILHQIKFYQELLTKI